MLSRMTRACENSRQMPSIALRWSARRSLSQPASRCSRFLGRKQLRAGDETRRQRTNIRAAGRGNSHAIFWSAPRRGKTSVARSPGSLSLSRSSPPCNVATADAETQPQPGSGQRPAGLQPHEALDRPRAVGFRNPRTTVGDAQQNRIAFEPGSDRDDGRFRRLTRGTVRRRLAVFDRVLDQICQRLTDEFAVAVQRRRLQLPPRVSAPRPRPRGS